MVKSTLNEVTNLSDSMGSIFGSEQYGRYQKGKVGGTVSGATGKKITTDITEDDDELIKKQLTLKQACVTHC